MHRSRSILFALIIALAVTIPAWAQTSHNGNFPGIKLKNFGQISDNYYRGAQPKGNDYADLAKLGVKTVINLASDDSDANEKTLVETAGMQYRQIPMTTHVPPGPIQIAEFLAIVNDPNSQPVFVHCVGGKHRTGVMTAIYRMTQYHWTADQAFQEMKQFDFGASFLHPEFKSFVYEYFKQFVSTPTVPDPQSPAPAKSAN